MSFDLNGKLAARFGAASLKQAVTKEEFYTLLSGMGDSIVEQLKAIKQRLRALELGGLRYLGTYQRAQVYRVGDTVTHDGSMWCCLKDDVKNITPGKSYEHWQLSAKSQEAGLLATVRLATAEAKEAAAACDVAVEAARKARLEADKAAKGNRAKKFTRVLSHDEKGRIESFITSDVGPGEKPQ